MPMIRETLFMVTRTDSWSVEAEPVIVRDLGDGVVTLALDDGVELELDSLAALALGKFLAAATRNVGEEAA